MDWLAIHAEYLKGDISQRNLADKYGISYNTLKERARREGWAKQRSTTHRKATAKAQQKIEDEIADDVVAAAQTTMKCTYILLDHLTKQVENLPKNTGTRLEHTITETKDDGKRSTTKMVMDLSNIVTILERLYSLYGGKDAGIDIDIEDLKDLREAVFGAFTS